METYLYTIRLTVRAPILSQAVGARTYGVDTAALRTPNDNPALPGSLIRGNLRHAWKRFAEVASSVGGVPSQDEINDWLGSPSGWDKAVEEDKPAPSADNEPRRARLLFAEFWQSESTSGNSLRHRIKREHDSGAVARGALQLIESPFAAREEIVFTGWIKAELRNADEAQRLTRWLRKGLEYVPALGALKGVGFGQVLKVEVDCQSLTARSTPTQTLQNPISAGLCLTLDRPFCFARPHAVNNRFESEEFIPGGAIKGSIARRLHAQGVSAWPSLHHWFDQLRITHAMAVCEPSDKQRPCVPPLSLVWAPQQPFVPGEDVPHRLYDMALRVIPGLIYGRAPAFAPDWKAAPWEQANACCGVASPTRRLAVRTAINPDTGAAWEEKLFSIESVAPEGYVWLANVDLNRIDAQDRAAVWSELANLLSPGLDMLGKTKAHAEVEIAEQPYALFPPSGPLLRQNLAIITLQSAARLLPQPDAIPPTNGGAVLLERYRAAWQELSQGSLRLLRFFARQALVGGNYLWTRFQHRQPPYNPELLTLPGSVFVLEAIDEQQATTCLERWLAQGLPQLKEAAGGEDWQKTPYIAANGYGEIAVNLELHWTLEPSEECWHELT